MQNFKKLKKFNSAQKCKTMLFLIKIGLMPEGGNLDFPLKVFIAFTTES